MKFTITSGNPTPEELLALEAALESRKPVDLKPVIKKSILAFPNFASLYIIKSPTAQEGLTSAENSSCFTVHIAKTIAC
jgi:hypothetical protein